MLTILANDPWLRPYAHAIEARHDHVVKREQALINATSGGSTLAHFASGHLYFGLHTTEKGWVLREWAPNAQAIYLLCDASRWRCNEDFRFSKLPNGVWELLLPLDKLSHGDHYKLMMQWQGGSGERIPAYAGMVVQDPDSTLFAAKVWAPNTPYCFTAQRPILGSEPLLIYEAHVGMATEEERVGSYLEFAHNLLPQIAAKGYNAIQLMAVMEHPYYGSFGYQVSSFFAPSSRFGTPDDLKYLIDEAHRLGLLVIMDLVHSHAVKNEEEGLAFYDGTQQQFFHAEARGRHPQWDSMCFDYGKDGVLHFLLSNCRYWLEEYHFDGFRFDGVTSMIYLSHGMGQVWSDYGDYYNGTTDDDALIYLSLANKMIHEIYPNAITIAEEVSGMPGLALPIVAGGHGFDYRLAMNIPDFWIKMVKERRDEEWHVGGMLYENTNRRSDEKVISYVESHDQALVGDKTLIFRLIDKEMYWHMDKADKDPTTERGIALHKMIRLLTLTTINGGYLAFMGNEWGHPEWIDFPREGNNWSYKYARRQWSLAENGFLKYEWLDAFDRAMLAYIKGMKHFECLPLDEQWIHNEDQVLAYTRGDMALFVYNFNPTVSFSDYRLLAPVGEYEIALDSDAKAYGGQARNDQSITHFTQHDPLYASKGKGWLRLYLPARTALVLRLKNSNKL